jgi:hypothetical protein
MLCKVWQDYINILLLDLALILEKLSYDTVQSHPLTWMLL